MTPNGESWVYGPDGSKYWGRFGAAGLLLVSKSGEVLLQHRVEWSHFGGLWGIPGGARSAGESAVDAAFRESFEEVGVRREWVEEPRFQYVLDLGFWSYTTVVADAVMTDFSPVVSDGESIAVRWVPVSKVADMMLHPRFAESWPILLAKL